MSTAINANYSAYAQYGAYAPSASTVQVAASPQQNGNTYSSDQADLTHKQAGMFKRMGHGISNFFSDVAGAMGMGSMAHFVKESFDRTDANRNNHLDLQEFTLVSQLTGVSLEQADKNGDQKVVYSEYKTLASALIKGLFQQADTSGDGFLNYAEAQTAGYVFATGNTDSFTASDANQDALLSRSEFLALNQNYYKGNKIP